MLPKRRGGTVHKQTHIDDPAIFAEVISNIDSGIIILDLQEESVLFLNDHAAGLLRRGQQRSDFSGLYKLLFEEKGKRTDTEIAMIRKDMVQCADRILGYSVYPLLSDRIRYIAVFMQDITEQKRMDSIASAVEMSKNIGFIFAGIRHEIGNPVNSVKMALAVLKSGFRTFSEDDFEKYFNRMSEDITRLEGLLLAFKNYNLYETPISEPVDLALFFSSLADLVGPDLERANIIFSYDISAAGKVLVDPRALQQIALNIIANSKDALNGRSDATLSIRAEESGALVRLNFSDNGCGMDNEQMRHIFKPFHTSKKHGTGLGMVITKKMLAQMDCGIEIDSKPGIGTTVTFILPKA